MSCTNRHLALNSCWACVVTINQNLVIAVALPLQHAGGDIKHVCTELTCPDLQQAHCCWSAESLQHLPAAALPANLKGAWSGVEPAPHLPHTVQHAAVLQRAQHLAAACPQAAAQPARAGCQLPHCCWAAVAGCQVLPIAEMLTGQELTMHDPDGLQILLAMPGSSMQRVPWLQASTKVVQGNSLKCMACHGMWIAGFLALLLTWRLCMSTLCCERPCMAHGKDLLSLSAVESCQQSINARVYAEAPTLKNAMTGYCGCV